MLGYIIAFFAGAFTAIAIISLLCMAARNQDELEESERWEKIQREMGGKTDAE